MNKPVIEPVLEIYLLHLFLKVGKKAALLINFVLSLSVGAYAGDFLLSVPKSLFLEIEGLRNLLMNSLELD